jgi:hypothetical protein
MIEDKHYLASLIIRKNLPLFRRKTAFTANLEANIRAMFPEITKPGTGSEVPQFCSGWNSIFMAGPAVTAHYQS